MFSGTKGYRTKPPAGVRLNPLHPLSQGLVGYWLFNEGAGSIAHDISGYGNHGTLVGMSTNAQSSGWGGSKFGGGLQFDGSGDYISKSTFTLTFPSTIIMWINPSQGALSQSRTILSRDGGTTFLWYYIEGGADNTKIDIYDGGSHIGTAGLLQEDEWQQVALTFDANGNGHHWYNGQQDAAFSTVNQPANPFELRIGEWSVYDWKGGIDSVRIYNRPLSPAEIKQLYEDPFCNLLRTPVRYAPAAPGGLSIPVAMNYYRRRRIA